MSIEEKRRTFEDLVYQWHMDIRLEKYGTRVVPRSAEDLFEQYENGKYKWAIIETKWLNYLATNEFNSEN